MKADVLPSAAPKLRISSWVPRAVATRAHEGYAAASQPDDYGLGDVAIKHLLRLVRDRRMRTVWHELGRRHRDGTYMHPATPATSVAAEDERQGAAMVELFDAALKYAMAPGIQLHAATSRAAAGRPSRKGSGDANRRGHGRVARGHLLWW